MSLLLALLVTGCAHAPDDGGPSAATAAPARASRAESRLLTFTDPQGRTYDAILTTPGAGKWNRHAVLLLGGGTVTDMHWTVPGSVEYQGEPIPLTTTGQATRDADAIAAALVKAGFAVMQYSSIHQGDIGAIENPALADYVPYAASRDIARAALAALRAQPGIDPDTISLVGHSLGGSRALQITADDPGIIALVLLAPAYSSRLAVPPSRAGGEAIDALAAQGLDADAGIPRHVFNAKHTQLPAPLNTMTFDALDQDDDETLRRWEIASALVAAHLSAGDASDLTDAPQLDGAIFPADVLSAGSLHPVPTLAIFAGQDPMSVHAPLIERAALARAATSEPALTVIILPNLGHNLGQQRPRDDTEHASVAGPNLTGPIDPSVPKLIAEWLSDVAAGAPTGGSGE